MSIGYACMVLGESNTTVSRCLLKDASDAKIKRVTLANLLALEAMIDYNIKNNISLFRISSDIIPFGSHPVNKVNWQLEFKDILCRIGSKINNAGIRVSMHPGQYTVLNSPTQRIVQNAIAELQYHSMFLDAILADNKSKIVLHIGGVYRDKIKSIEAFINNFYTLPEYVKKRIIIENDDKNYSIEDVLEISGIIKIPVVFDNLHNLLNPPNDTNSEFEWIELCGKTWGKCDGKQKIHYSQKKIGGNNSAHSSTINVTEFINFYDKLYNKNIDIMLEVKDKNLSATKCINVINSDISIGSIEREWARYKYLVLSKSASLYIDIRNMLKNKENVDVIGFYEIIDTAMLLENNVGAQINAAQHIWGYLNKECSKAEKNRFEKLIIEYKECNANVSSLKKHLLKCAIKQDVTYLKNSYYFYL